jgi:hypothetical protein
MQWSCPNFPPFQECNLAIFYIWITPFICKSFFDICRHRTCVDAYRFPNSFPTPLRGDASFSVKQGLLAEPPLSYVGPVKQAYSNNLGPI